jgi:superfamily I DNA/RNA helicase
MGVEAALLAVKEKSIPGLSTSHQARLASLMVAVETLRNSAYGASVRDRLRTVLSPALASEPLREAAIRLVEMSVSFSRDIKGFFRALSLQTDTDLYRYDIEKVTLMTMHSAKGLEFPVVFIAGCENGLIPYGIDDRDTDNIDEERRLFYVAATRAKELLVLSWARHRSIRGIKRRQTPSPFISDIGEPLKQTLFFCGDRSKGGGPVQMPLF